MKKIYLLFGLLSFSINAQTAGNGFTDIDGNFYPSVIVGNQEWMTTNLRVTKFNNGLSIQYQPLNVADNTGPTNPRYFKEGNNDNNIIDKGLLYNWFAINNPNFIPNVEDGWRIPSQADWEQLNNFVGQVPLLAKANGSILWNTTPISTDQYGFSLLPTGGVGFNINNSIYTFTNGGNSARFWTNVSYDGAYAKTIQYVCNPTIIAYQPAIQEKRTGRSIRLVKNAALSTNQFEKANIKIYPNPVQNQLNIESQEEVLSIEIFDFLGKHILTFNGAKTIDVSELQSGIYLLKINTNQGSSIQKIIKQ